MLSHSHEVANIWEDRRTQRLESSLRKSKRPKGETFFTTKLILLRSTLIFLISCATHRRSAEELERDKAEVFRTSVWFWQAYERKDLATTSEMLTKSNDLTFFGSDAAEVVRTRSEWETLMRNDWQLITTGSPDKPSGIIDETNCEPCKSVFFRGVSLQ